MGLSTGTRLGPYEIVSPLGAGGMGEVYCARDTRLDRTVAIKVLNAALVATPDAKGRFEREAKTISQLNHPNICTLYDVGHQDGTDYLVMEFLEGETLADRLKNRGALPLQEVVRIGCEIADALDKAHRAGIVHRDLKPGNVMLTKSGAKLLDFGLAKPSAMGAAAGSASAPLLSAAMTMTTPAQQHSPLTQQGSLVGTVQYMSPEQIQGMEADSRSDIFAFGAMLYEMATGKRAFEGKSQIKVASAILEDEPAPVTLASPSLPPKLGHVISTCLTKTPDERYQSILDVKHELRWIAQDGSRAGTRSPASAPGNRSLWVAAGIAVVAVLLSALLGWDAWHREAPGVVISALPMPAKIRLQTSGRNGPPSISPDGTRIAFVAADNGDQAIWVRRLDSPEAVKLPGTDRGYFPFWSPDSRWLAFFADGKLRKVPIAGGPPQEVCIAQDSRGASWGKDGTILLTPRGRASTIYRVPSTGGDPVEVTHFQSGYASHRWPSFLPDGKHFLYLASVVGSDNLANEIRFASLDGKEDRPVLRVEGSNPQYAAGNLFFVRSGALLAVAMDAASGKITGEAGTISDSVGYETLFSSGSYSVSQAGMLVYLGGGVVRSQLTWLNAAGTAIGRVGEPSPISYMRLSPDEKHAVAIARIQSSLPDVWVFDTVRNVPTRITFDRAAAGIAWSPDGKELAMSSYAFGNFGPASSINPATVGPAGTAKRNPIQIYRKPADGAGEMKLVAGLPDRDEWLTDWSIDGKYLLFYANDPNTRLDVWAMPADGGKPFPVVNGPADEINGRLSPDGRWLLYTGNESGRNEIYIAPFQHGQGKWLVSTSGGAIAVWGRDGKALYYTSNGSDIWMVPVNGRGDTPELGTPRKLFQVPLRALVSDSFEVTRDGRFLVVSAGEESDTPLTLVQNWPAQLKK